MYLIRFKKKDGKYGFRLVLKDNLNGNRASEFLSEERAYALINLNVPIYENTFQMVSDNNEKD